MLSPIWASNRLFFTSKHNLFFVLFCIQFHFLTNKMHVPHLFVFFRAGRILHWIVQRPKRKKKLPPPPSFQIKQEAANKKQTYYIVIFNKRNRSGPCPTFYSPKSKKKTRRGFFVVLVLVVETFSISFFKI